MKNYKKFGFGLKLILNTRAGRYPSTGILKIISRKRHNRESDYNELIRRKIKISGFRHQTLKGLNRKKKIFKKVKI